MGSPISSTMAETYLQFLKETHIKLWLESKEVKLWLESKEVIYYKWYVDDILIIFNQNKTNEQTVLNHVNKINKHIQFKISTEDNNLTIYLDLSIQRNNNNIDTGIYNKSTCTDTTIHFSPNHPYEHKLASFNYYINRMLTLPITGQSKHQEWKIILTIAWNNGFLTHIIHGLKKQLTTRKKNENKMSQQYKKTNNG